MTRSAWSALTAATVAISSPLAGSQLVTALAIRRPLITVANFVFMADHASFQSGASHRPAPMQHLSPFLQGRPQEDQPDAEACNVSFNVWVKPSNPIDEEDTASSSSSSSKTDDDLLRCDEEIDEDSISISSKRPAFSPYLEHRPAKRMRATTLPAIKDDSPLPRWDILAYSLTCA